MKITVLGSGKEVGRSGFMVTSDGSNILLDYGVLLKKEPLFPIHIRPKDIGTVVLTHAHFNHFPDLFHHFFYPMPTSPSLEQIQPLNFPIYLSRI